MNWSLGETHMGISSQKDKSFLSISTACYWKILGLLLFFGSVSRGVIDLRDLNAFTDCLFHSPVLRLSSSSPNPHYPVVSFIHSHHFTTYRLTKLNSLLCFQGIVAWIRQPLFLPSSETIHPRLGYFDAPIDTPPPSHFSTTNEIITTRHKTRRHDVITQKWSN